MATSIGSSSLSRIITSSSSLCSSSSHHHHHHHPRRNSKMSLSWRIFDGQRRTAQQLTYAKEGVESSQLVQRRFTAKEKPPNRQLLLFATSEDHVSNSEIKSDDSEQVKQQGIAESISPVSTSVLQFEGAEGKPGYISFYGRPYKGREETVLPVLNKNRSNLLLFIAPTILVASFIVPSLYLRRILSSVFEDSLLTDFLILFFTEALFYCGVAVFLLFLDRLQKSLEPVSSPKSNRWQTTQLVHRISSVASLALSLIIPMVTMGLVWPWTGPAASATLAPFLVGIVVQFAFEQYARYLKSPSWTVIPIIFQVYRLHQLNRASQLVTALSFTVRGAEATSHNLAINSSLSTLLNVLHFLGIICIWSLASFLMRFFPSSAAIPES